MPARLLCDIISRSRNRQSSFEGEIHTSLKEYRRTSKGMKDKRNRHGTVGKSSRNNIFVNPLPPLPLLCEISGALHLAQPGLMAGRLAVGRRNTGIQVNFKIFKVGCRSKHLTCRFV